MMRQTPTNHGEYTEHFTVGRDGVFLVQQDVSNPNPENPPKKLELYIL